MSDFLIELFSEEIPARMQAAALEHLQSSLEKALAASESTGFVTPRRLAVIIKDLPATQADINKELKGPRIDAPAAALEGFLKKNNLTIEQLEKRDGIYFATIHEPGKPTAEILKPIIEEILAKFPWPKSMRWGVGDAVWVRPLQSILCIFDGKIVALEFAGIKAGNIIYGHRFLAPQPIIINKVSEYEPTLEKSFVIPSREKRKAEILKQAQKIAENNDLSIKKDDVLLEEVVGLVENPKVLLGKIDDKFMDLPPEVLTMVMRSHQKYFALQDSSGALSPYFLITSNMETLNNGSAIIAGNERVLRARFADARFFWDSDRKKPLGEWAQGLKTVTYHAKLGTVADKVNWIKDTIMKIYDDFSFRSTHQTSEFFKTVDIEKLHKAADLCKADLVTGMVGEFPELQGIMGKYYAIQQDEYQEVADAINDHYKPQGANDSLPTTLEGAVLSLADKLVTLIKMFEVEKPTSSKDPFALRRMALGVIRIVDHYKLNLNLDKLGVTRDLALFLHDRLIVKLKDENIPIDVIKSISFNNNILLFLDSVRTINGFKNSTDGVRFLSIYRRAFGLVSEYKSKKDSTNQIIEVQYDELKDSDAIHLWQSIAQANLEFDQIFGFDIPIYDGSFSSSLNPLLPLIAPINDFIDNNIINADDIKVKLMRLGLLNDFIRCVNRVADFSKIEG